MRILLILAIGFSVSSLVAEEPVELQGLRKSYHSALDRAVKPVSQTYLDELKRMRDNFTRNAQLEAAVAVQKEIDLIESKMKTLGSPVADAEVKVLEAVAVIPANSMEGFKLGPVRRGDVITLNYVSGLWKNDGNIPTENPDAAQTDRGERTRLAIAEPPTDGRPGKVVKMIPPHTQNSPFQYLVQTSRDNVVLRIHYGGDNPKAPGAVTYKVKITR